MSSSPPPPLSLSSLSGLSEESFVAAIGGVYENSPWVASAVFTNLKPLSITSIASLHAAMKEVVETAEEEKKLELINSHPDLAGKAALADELTEESKEEQSKAGLNSLTKEELEQFTKMNEKYKSKFGFVFILAVRNATKYTILKSFEARLKNTRMKEFEECITQIHKIAWMRLLTILEPADTGFLTCHVLDTASGKPANDMDITLERLSGTGPLGVIGSFVTNSDGRLTSGRALTGKDFSVGIYKWTFEVGDYFAKEGAKLAGTPFLTSVPLVFGIDDPEDHYHVPLLCSPYGYSTYRGS